MLLVSFDIDGTMEFGDPPGILSKSDIAFLRLNGVLLGSASDRTYSTQIRMWAEYEFSIDFAIVKHKIAELKDTYHQANSFWHVGDRPIDQQTAFNSGFTFFWPDQFPTEDVVKKFINEKNKKEFQSLQVTEIFNSVDLLNQLGLYSLSLERDPLEVQKYDQYASSGRVEGDDFGNALPI